MTGSHRQRYRRRELISMPVTTGALPSGMNAQDNRPWSWFTCEGVAIRNTNPGAPGKMRSTLALRVSRVTIFSSRSKKTQSSLKEITFHQKAAWIDHDPVFSPSGRKFLSSPGLRSFYAAIACAPRRQVSFGRCAVGAKPIGPSPVTSGADILLVLSCRLHDETPA